MVDTDDADADTRVAEGRSVELPTGSAPNCSRPDSSALVLCSRSGGTGRVWFLAGVAATCADPDGDAPEGDAPEGDAPDGDADDSKGASLRGSGTWIGPRTNP